MAAKFSESRVDQALAYLLERNLKVDEASVQLLIKESSPLKDQRDVQVKPVDLKDYDALLRRGGAQKC